MKQIFKQHACSKRAVYSDPGSCGNFSLSVIGSCPSRAMPSSHLRQAVIRTQFNAVASVHDRGASILPALPGSVPHRRSQTTLSTLHLKNILAFFTAVVNRAMKWSFSKN